MMGERGCSNCGGNAILCACHMTRPLRVELKPSVHPDRAARIRALADRWVGTMLHGPNGDEWMDAERSWNYARTCVDELDRLEAADRGEGRGKP